MAGGQQYKTNQRKLICDYIEGNRGEHITADEVLFALRKAGHRIGKATIYRCFDMLEKEGLLLKYPSVDGGSACYEYADGAGECSEHYHLKCDVCGRLFHTECTMLDEVAEHMEREHNFKINKFKTVFYGTCADCAAKEEVSKDE